MEKLLPIGSNGKHFARVWVMLTILLIMICFALKEYRDGLKFHKRIQTQIDTIEWKVKALDKRLDKLEGK